MSSNRTLYGTISATAPYGSTITQLDVKFTPEQSSTPSLMPETNTVYLTRATEGTGELMELVGGSVAWNQLADVKTINITANTGSVTQRLATFNLVNTHRLLVGFTQTANVATSTRNTPQFVNEQDGTRILMASAENYHTSAGRYWWMPTNLSSVSNGSTQLQFWSHTPSVSYSIDDVVLYDLTQMLGSAIADYVYSLEQQSAGSGIAWLKKYDLIDDQYHAYSAPTLQSVEATAHVTKDADDAVIATYPLDSDLVLRGIPKLTNGVLSYDGDTYEWDGTVTRYWKEVDLGDLTWVNYKSGGFRAPLGDSVNATSSSGNELKVAGYDTKASSATLTNGMVSIAGGSLHIVNSDYTTDAAAFKTGMQGTKAIYLLATQVTETADPFTAVQTVEDGGTEEFVTTNGVPVGVVGRFANAVPMEGVDSFTVTADDGTTHTYPVTLSEEIYRGYVDMLTGEAISDMASIAEYNGETINSPWLSSLDVYAPGATPTKGAQVVYPITPEEVTATITGDPTELGEVTSVTSTKGTVKWGNMMPLGLKAELTIDSPF